ncbi:NUDIX domain containing protein [Amanita muscaria]
MRLHHHSFSHARPLLIASTLPVRSHHIPARLSTTSRRFTTGSNSTPEMPEYVSPRPSASLIVVNERNEVLMVQRNPAARSFGGAHVFPGGNFDLHNDTTLQMTAVRETFEETGILLASPPLVESKLSESDRDKARGDIHSGKLRFQNFLDKRRLGLDLYMLLPFTNWTTPETAPRRFRTQFFIVFLSAFSPSQFSSGSVKKTKYRNRVHGGLEVISARFLHPKDALSEFRRKMITLMPPQFYILSTLSGILSGNVNTEEQRNQITRLSSGAFGSLSIRPKSLSVKGGDGRTILTYEGDETRGGPPGRLHRALVKFDTNGVRNIDLGIIAADIHNSKITSEIELQRNFNIFKDLGPAAKL